MTNIMFSWLMILFSKFMTTWLYVVIFWIFFLLNREIWFLWFWRSDTYCIFMKNRGLRKYVITLKNTSILNSFLQIIVTLFDQIIHIHLVTSFYCPDLQWLGKVLPSSRIFHVPLNILEVIEKVRDEKIFAYPLNACYFFMMFRKVAMEWLEGSPELSPNLI